MVGSLLPRPAWSYKTIRLLAEMALMTFFQAPLSMGGSPIPASMTTFGLPEPTVFSCSFRPPISTNSIRWLIVVLASTAGPEVAVFCSFHSPVRSSDVKRGNWSAGGLGERPRLGRHFFIA